MEQDSVFRRDRGEQRMHLAQDILANEFDEVLEVNDYLGAGFDKAA
jgi:hypothetical protein